jgi:hypothetical protein
VQSDPHFIPPADAAVLTARWRQNAPPGSFNGAMFHRVAFDNLLGQAGCEGIRIYMGMEPAAMNGNPSLWTLVLVGTDAMGNDMVASAPGGATQAGGGTEQFPFPCPPTCGAPSILNSPP